MADVCCPSLEREEYQEFINQFNDYLQRAQESYKKLNEELIPHAQALLNGNLKTFMERLGFRPEELPDWIEDVKDVAKFGERSLVMEKIRVSVAVTMFLSKILSPGLREDLNKYTDELREFVRVYKEYSMSVSALDMCEGTLPDPSKADELGLFVPMCPECFSPVAFVLHGDLLLRSLAEEYFVDYSARKQVEAK